MKTIVTHNDIIAILEKHAIVLPKNAIEWRVPRDGDNQLFYGKHTALRYHVTLLLTDGIVAWFLQGDGETLLHGHLANFEREKEAKAAYAGARVSTVKSAARKRLEELCEED